MLKGQDIICISSIDWDFIWQGHQEIMTRFARNGNRVFFVENTGVRTPSLKDMPRLRSRLANWRKGVGGIRKIEDNLYVYSPLVLPFPYLRIARFINKSIVLGAIRKWLRLMKAQSPIIWTFLPTGLALDIADSIDYKALVYYCIDSFIASSKGAARIKETEAAVIKRSDLVFVTSGELRKYCLEFNKNIYDFPFGVNLENFQKVRDSSDTTPPEDMAHIKAPIAGYVGGIHKWIDFELLAYIAEKNPEVSFVMVGPVQTSTEKIASLKNVFMLGQKSSQDLPMYVKYFDACLIPYLITDYTKNVYPTKMNEYLSMGKPVISTKLPEVVEFNSAHSGAVSVAGSAEDFSDKLKMLIRSGSNKEDRSLRISQAEKNTWALKVEEMSFLIEEKMRSRMEDQQKNWILNLKRVYKNTKRGVLKSIVAALAIYIVIFHTNAGWYIGKPLEIVNAPVKSDVIAVLGGGVGESGRAGQGYQERVSKAVELYDNGYSAKIIYSTGYKYILKEAETMATLSVSMGVKRDNIIIEDDSITTRDNVVNVGKILNENGWNSIIMVSSKYHMKRLELLCRKNLPGVRVVYVPTRSDYYSGAHVTPRHLQGFIHEYLAILFYMIKGYI